MAVRILVEWTCDYPRCRARTEVDEHERPEGWSVTAKGEHYCGRH